MTQPLVFGQNGISTLLKQGMESGFNPVCITENLDQDHMSYCQLKHNFKEKKKDWTFPIIIKMKKIKTDNYTDNYDGI